MGVAVPGAIKKSAGLPAIFSATPVQRAFSALNPASQRPCAWQSLKLSICSGLCIALPCSAILRAGGREKLLRHRAAATLSAVAVLPSLLFPALSAVVLTKAEPPILFQNFLCSLFLLRCAQKEKAGQKF